MQRDRSRDTPPMALRRADEPQARLARAAHEAAIESREHGAPRRIGDTRVDRIGEVHAGAEQIQRPRRNRGLFDGYRGKPGERQKQLVNVATRQPGRPPQHPFRFEEDGQRDPAGMTVDQAPRSRSLSRLVSQQVPDDDVSIDRAHDAASLPA